MEPSAKPAPPRPGSPLVVAICAVAGILFIGAPVLVRVFVLEAFQVPSGTMIPSLLVGDHFFANKLRREAHRGDVIVFKYPRDPSSDYVQRVVAVGGDSIELSGTAVILNGVTLPHRRTYSPCPEGMERAEGCDLWEETLDGRRFEVLYEKGRPSFHLGPVRVPPGTVFVVGDNRDNSADSRVWGPVPLDLVKGEASVLWWSRGEHGVRWNRIGQAVP